MLNRDDATVMRMTAPGAQVVTFGTGEPEAAGDFGLVNERGVLWLPAGLWAMQFGARSLTPILYGLGVTALIVAGALGLRWLLRARVAGLRAPVRDRLVFTLLGLAGMAYWTRPLEPWGPFQPARPGPNSWLVRCPVPSVVA